jgi:threonine/homoserine/homoserine lactone efflux protein
MLTILASAFILGLVFNAAPGPVFAETVKDLRSGVVLSVTNPQNVAYWAAIGTALGALGVQQPTLSDYSVFFVKSVARALR